MKSENLMPHWQEGMLLKPQHFQSLSRYLENLGSGFYQYAHPYYWGIRELDISPDEVANEVISVRRAVVYLKDGSSLRIPEEGEPPARNFKKALDQGDGRLEVFLAVPRRQRSLPVVGPDTNARYRIIQQESEDENTGTNPVMLEYRAYNTKLVFGDEALHGYEALPIARIRRSSERDNAPELDPDFSPPCVDLQAMPILENRVRDVVHLLEGKSRDLAQQLISRRVSFGSEGAGDSENLLKLHVANANLPLLKQATMQRGFHPFTAWTLLARLLGELSIFTNERVLPDIAAYDHENPAPSLKALIEAIKAAWSGPDTRYFEKRSFTKVDEGLTVELEESWLEEGLELYLCVDSANPPEVVNQVMQTNIRMGNISDMPNFKRFNVIGVARTLLKNPPPVLPRRDTSHFFRIEPKGNFWTSVKTHRNVTLGYLGESEDLILEKLKNSEENLFTLYVILRPES